MTPIDSLKERLSYIPQAPYPNHSRLHPLKSFHFPHTAIYIKREDELGFGITGSKIRKYRSLIPYLLSQDIEEVLVIGSAYSNHVLGISQLLIENNLNPILLLRGDPTRELKGNAFLTTLLVEKNSIHWFSKSQWATVHNYAKHYIQQTNRRCFILPEGACIPESLPGALSLALDIIQNEKENNVAFDHLFVDSGTGLTAIALILAYQWLGKKSMIHVFLMVEDETYFLQQLTTFHSHFQQLMQRFDLPLPTGFQLHKPQRSPRFGQVHPLLFQDIIKLARAEGFLTDPIYTGKLFHETQTLIQTQELKGQMLIIHSGGALTLMGFEEQLKSAFLSLHPNEEPHQKAAKPHDKS